MSCHGFFENKIDNDNEGAVPTIKTIAFSHVCHHLLLSVLMLLPFLLLVLLLL